MKERPILFSTEMVQAILDGRKTMTRRIVKLQPTKPVFIGIVNSSTDNKIVGSYAFADTADGGYNTEYFKCPYGQPGDILWVRESHYKTTAKELNGQFFYKASFEELGWSFKWKPSIHMPKAAARIYLQVESVKVERLQDISRGDSMSEGCPFPNIAKETNPKEWFSDLWKSINGPESWQQNPWVWAISFKVLSTTGRPDHLNT